MLESLTMLSRIWEFITEAGGWAVASNSTSFVLFIIGIIQVSRYGSTITTSFFFVLSVILFWIGGFIAWNNERNKREEIEERLKASGPRIYMQAAVDFGQNITYFTLTNRGTTAAHLVSVSSEIGGIAPFPAIDCIPAGETSKVIFGVEGGVNHGNNALPLLGLTYQRERQKQPDEYFNSLTFPIKIVCTDHTFKREFVSECEVMYYPERETEYARELIKISQRLFMDIIVVQHSKFYELKEIESEQLKK